MSDTPRISVSKARLLHEEYPAPVTARDSAAEKRPQDERDSESHSNDSTDQGILAVGGNFGEGDLR